MRYCDETKCFYMYATFIMLIMFTPARDFLLETPWRIIIPNPNDNKKMCEPFILCISQA
jgi:hypothetical protein